MTPVLCLALYVENNSLPVEGEPVTSPDKRFLPQLIQRTAQKIIDVQGRFPIDVLPLVILNDCVPFTTEKYRKRVLEAARYASGYHAVILHRDADHSTNSKALRQYIHPILRQVQIEIDAGQQICETVIAVIPIREIEAWMLADPEALCDVLETNVKAEDLGLPRHAHEVQTIIDRKRTLNQAVRMTHFDADPGDLYESLADTIRLDRLEQVGAYQNFMRDLTEVLRKHGLLE